MSYYTARNLRKQFRCWGGNLSSNPRAFILIYLPCFFSSFLAQKKERVAFLKKQTFCYALLCAKSKNIGKNKTARKKREERGGERRVREREDEAAEKKKKKHLGCQFSSCEFVCRTEAGQAVKKLLIFFLTTCMRLFAYVLVPSAPSPLPPPSHSSFSASC